MLNLAADSVEPGQTAQIFRQTKLSNGGKGFLHLPFSSLTVNIDPSFPDRCL